MDNDVAMASINGNSSSNTSGGGNSAEQTVEVRHLSEINADCLDEIFKYLDSADLVELADANLNSNEDILNVFTNGEISVRTHPYEASIRNHFLKKLSDGFVSNDPRFARGFEKAFRYFGPLIPEVSLHYDIRHYRRYARMEQVICDHATALTEIVLINADMSAFENISRQFELVDQIKFEGGWLSQTLCDLGRWFPNLTYLMLNGTQIADPKLFEMPIPSLKVLSVKNKHVCRYDRLSRHPSVEDPLDFTLSDGNLERFIRLNPQLQSLTIFQDNAEVARDTNSASNECLIQLNPPLLQMILCNLRNLDYLKINIEEGRGPSRGHHDNIGHNDTEVIHFRHLNKLIIEVKCINQLRSLMHITSNFLDHLTITVHSTLGYNVLCEFIGRFKRIESLLIQHRALDVHNIHFMDLMTRLVDLKSMQITLLKDNMLDDVCHIISTFNRLNELTIRCTEMEDEDRDSFVKGIDPVLSRMSWQVCRNCSDFIFTAPFKYRHY